MGWTDERVEQLKSLWTEGLSASQIARVLGGVTRNAVIGKVHRLGLAGRAGPARTERPRSMSPRSVVRIAVPEPEIIEEDPVVLEDGRFATVLTINDRMCRWPIGDPAESNSTSAAASPKRARPIARHTHAKPINRSNSGVTGAQHSSS